VVIRRLSLLWKRFSPLEERLLAAVRTVLPVDALQSFDAQVAAINRVQRLPPSWSEIDFYRIRGGKPDWAGISMFPCTDEFRLANVAFRVHGKRYKATLHCIGGHIFDFAITPGARGVSFDQWDAKPGAVLLADPLRAATGERKVENLPVEWQTFLAEHSSTPPIGWELHDGRSAYRVALDDGQYLVLAAREGDEFILQRLEPPAAHLFHVVHHDSVPEPLQRELKAVMGRRTAKP
jgi:hypothetical protein